MKNRFVILALISVVIAALFIVLKSVGFDRTSEVTAEVEKQGFKPAPDFALLGIDGSEQRLSDFKDNVIILDFWATWCPPCRAEIPHFIELYDDYRDKGLEIIGIALDRNAEDIVAFVEERAIDYTILFGKREVSELYGGIMSIPTTFVIGRDGRIRKKYIGYRDKEIFEEDIKGLL